MKRLMGVWGLLAVCLAACGDDPNGAADVLGTRSDETTPEMPLIPPVPEPEITGTR